MSNKTLEEGLQGTMFLHEKQASDITRRVLDRISNLDESVRVFVKQEDLVKMIQEELGGMHPLPDPSTMKAATDTEFDMQTQLKLETYDEYMTALQGLEEAFSALFIANSKCQEFGITDIGQEGYPFAHSMEEMYSNVVKWNAHQKIVKFNKTGE